jgi:hypothetical protein
MDGGSEGRVGGNDRRQGQPRRHETHCGRLDEEHDGAARSVKQRRAGNRFRYRRRRQAVPYLRLAQDAPFHVIFLQPFGPRLLGQALWPPLGPSLSGPTPKATGLWSGLQSRPTLPALGSPLTTVPLLTSYTQQLFLVLSRQQLAPAAPTRRSAILAHGPPSPTRT